MRTLISVKENSIKSDTTGVIMSELYKAFNAYAGTIESAEFSRTILYSNLILEDKIAIPPFWIETFDEKLTNTEVYPYIFKMDKNIENNIDLGNFRNEFCEFATFFMESLFDSNHETIKNSINEIKHNSIYPLKYYCNKQLVYFDINNKIQFFIYNMNLYSKLNQTKSEKISRSIKTFRDAIFLLAGNHIMPALSALITSIDVLDRPNLSKERYASFMCELIDDAYMSEFGLEKIDLNSILKETYLNRSKYQHNALLFDIIAADTGYPHITEDEKNFTLHGLAKITRQAIINHMKNLS